MKGDAKEVCQVVFKFILMIGMIRSDIEGFLIVKAYFVKNRELLEFLDISEEDHADEAKLLFLSKNEEDHLEEEKMLPKETSDNQKESIKLQSWPI